MLVKDIMSRPVVTIEEEKTAKNAGEIMRRTRKGCLVVTTKGKSIGILADSDLIKKVIAKNLKASEIKVKNIMTTPLVTVSPNDDILVAVRKMKKSNIHRLPVILDGKPVGVISLTDIARTSPEMLDLLEYRLKMKETPFEIKEDRTSGICDSCGNYFTDLKNVNDQWLCEDCKEEMEA